MAMIALPKPVIGGDVPFENILNERRSVRDFEDLALSLAELGQLFWAAQGITDPGGLRTAPSAGALYPLELYAIMKGSDQFGAGIYHYLPNQHNLITAMQGDYMAQFANAAHNQQWIDRAGLILIIAAAYHRMTIKYGDRGRLYVAIEAGHVAQNVYLQALSLSLGATEVGAFHDKDVSRLLRLPKDQVPVTSVVVGRPSRATQ